MAKQKTKNEELDGRSLEELHGRAAYDRHVVRMWLFKGMISPTQNGGYIEQA